MIMRTINKIEDIYPCTIVIRRFGGVAIVEGESDFTCVGDLQWNEEWSYGDTTQRSMEDGWSHIAYGVGDSLDEAFKDFLKRKKEIDERPKRDYEKDPLTPQEEFIKKSAELMANSLSLGNMDFKITPMDGPVGQVFHLDYIYDSKKYYSGNT